MSLLRELVRHLTDEESQPLAKRIKLAGNAYKSVKVNVPNKEDILINWLSETANKSGDIDAWRTLHRCLSRENPPFRAALKASLVETLLVGLKSTESHEMTAVVFACCYTMLNDKGIMKFLTSRPKRFVELLKLLKTDNPSIKKTKIQIYQSILQHLNEVVFDVQKEIDGFDMKNYFQDVIDEILSMDTLDSPEYDCLSEMAIFNPLIIEIKLENIFEKILLAEKSTEKVQLSYENLMTNILEASTRLRQEKKLVGWILKALKLSLDSKVDLQLTPHMIDDILPRKFLDKFTVSIRNLTSVLPKVLISFIYHFDVQNVDSLANDNVGLHLSVVSRLTVAFLEGVDIFDYSTPLIAQQSFANSIEKLGNTLTKLARFLLTSGYRKKPVTASILSVISCLEWIIGLMKHYIPDSLSEETLKPLESNMEDINMLMSSQNLKSTSKLNREIVSCQFERDRMEKKDVFHDKLLEKIEKTWIVMLEKYPYAISQLKEQQLRTLAGLLVSDTEFTNENTIKSTKITSRIIHNSRSLVNALIYECFWGIHLNLNDSTPSVTQCLLSRIMKMSWKSNEIHRVLEKCGKLLAEPQWAENHEYPNFFHQNLEILRLLPLVHLGDDWKTLVFLVTYAIGKEWSQSKAVTADILMDVVESSKIHILQYIPLEFIVSDLGKIAALTPVFQYSLNLLENYNDIATFIKNQADTGEYEAIIILECIEKSKSKLKVSEKDVVQKIEKKLIKKMVKTLENLDDIVESRQIKNLTVAVKILVISDKKVSESILRLVNLVLQKIFEVNDGSLANVKMEDKDLFVEEGLQLIKIIFQHKTLIPIDATVIRNTWKLMWNYPRTEIVINLFEVTVPEALQKVLHQLTRQTIEKLHQRDNCGFEKLMTIWNCLPRVDMSGRSTHIRQKNMQNVLNSFTMSTILASSGFEILKFCTNVIAAKKAILSDENIDLIAIVAYHIFRNFGDITADICDQEINLVLAFVKYRSGVMADRLPVLLSVYRKIFRYIVDESRRENSSCSEHQLQCLALNANKLTVALVKSKRDMARLSPYVIADLVAIYSEGVVPPYVKEPLDDAVNMLLSICDHHSIALLLRALPPSMQEIFRNMHENYKKFAKFTGKI